MEFIGAVGGHLCLLEKIGVVVTTQLFRGATGHDRP